MNSEEREGLKQIRERQEHNKSTVNDYEGHVPKWLQTAYSDIDFLLSLIDSQAADYTRPAGWQDAMQRADPRKVFITFDTRENAEAFMRGLQPTTDAATRMRDLCVQKVKAMAEVWLGESRAESYDPRSNELYERCVAARSVVKELESLTLEQVK